MFIEKYTGFYAKISRSCVKRYCLFNTKLLSKIGMILIYFRIRVKAQLGDDEIAYLDFPLVGDYAWRRNSKIVAGSKFKPVENP
jgi:hypothetical protein